MKAPTVAIFCLFVILLVNYQFTEGRPEEEEAETSTRSHVTSKNKVACWDQPCYRIGGECCDAGICEKKPKFLIPGDCKKTNMTETDEPGSTTPAGVTTAKP